MIGDRLGKWVIYKELGRGGMGRVYLAQEEIGGRQAALKILAAELAQEVGFLDRFQNEIATLSTLDHPGIVRFYEAGFENDIYFYAMEYVEGQSLEQVLHIEKRLPWQDVLTIAQQICPALKHVHDNGIIHRDIKPPNILLTPEGRIKLTDFGIAKVFAGKQLTATGGVIGTPEFIAPEQAEGKPVSKRTDLYSLGVVLYMLLTGRPPFQGSNAVELLHKHRYARFDAPSLFVPELPADMEKTVCQLLEKDPAKRPADCMVLSKQLERVRRQLSRKDSATPVDPLDMTIADNRTQRPVAAAPAGPATLMSRLMREELGRQNATHPFVRLINRFWVLAPMLALCLSIIVWAFWPASQESLFSQGSELMASNRLSDMETAWREYLEPLNSRFPDHPYKDEVEKFHEQLEAARSSTPGEAQRFFQRGERLAQLGELAAAQRVWKNVVEAFADVPSEKLWVQRARASLDDLTTKNSEQARPKSAKVALDHALDLKTSGRVADAEKIWTALEELYRSDPGAGELLDSIRRARSR